jgi:hypothetical protein
MSKETIVAFEGLDGFVDHSIQEILQGKPAEQHTSVLLVARSASLIQSVATAIQTRLFEQGRSLGKWKGQDVRYKRLFAEALQHALPGSGVEIFAVSCDETAVLETNAIRVDKLHLRNHYREDVDENGKTVITLGPFYSSQEKQTLECTLAASRIHMLLLIIWFIVSAHEQVFAVRKSMNSNLLGLDLFLFLDRFAGDNNARYPALSVFQGISNGLVQGRGNIRSSFFTDSEPPEDRLTDCVAGLLNQYFRGDSASDRVKDIIDGENVTIVSMHR